MHMALPHCMWMGAGAAGAGMALPPRHEEVEEPSSSSLRTEKNGTSSNQMLTEHPSAGDHEKAMMGLLLCCLCNAGNGSKIFS